MDRKEVLRQWVSALRSGEYNQGKGCLRDSEDNYCCLGVLSDLVKNEVNCEWEKALTLYSDIDFVKYKFKSTISKYGNCEYLTTPIQKLLNLGSNPDIDKSIVIQLSKKYNISLDKLKDFDLIICEKVPVAWLNDKEYSFDFIADCIELEFKLLEDE